MIEARRRAVHSLEAHVVCEPANELVERAGVHRAAHATAMVQAMSRAVWH